MGKISKGSGEAQPSPLQHITTEELLAELRARGVRVEEKQGWLTPTEVAELLGTTRQMVYTACRELGLRHARIGNEMGAAIRIHRDWVDIWLEKRSVVFG